ncbi:hypothetical protein FLK61_41450 [Paenalkalicoccus suaedae]|uniref:DUF2178 domain-containing protein n=1 Tax=Paenalkalicoccus suaedae TaxID=2592382 RepID=A0A859FJT5_9BACI|nr:hypothetical protein FLK61_41450 [Paenalkalicoccus suaedae]
MILASVLIAIGDFTVINNMQRPDLVSIGVAFLGVSISTLALIKIAEEKSKSEKQRIEEEDERNVMINNMAKSKAFDLMIITFPIFLLTLTVMGYMSSVAFFSFVMLFLVYFFYSTYRLFILKSSF